ncbi:MAG: hypothetical protein H0Z28_12980 [Archaeoglobus sp.]|nr:hypothetical protein [Archaeoglobus sp.]
MNRSLQIVITIIASAIPAMVLHAVNLIGLKDALIIFFLALYGILLIGIYWELYGLRKSVDSHSKFSLIATDLISKIGESYLSYIEHENPKRLINEVMKRLTSAQSRIAKMLMSPGDIKYELSPDELKQLLMKYQSGTLTKKEAMRLKELLEKEKSRKESEGKLADAIFIGLLILGVILLLASLLSEEKNL